MNSVKELFLVVLAVFLFSEIQAQDLNQVDAAGKKQGKWIRKYSNGTKAYEGQFKDDKPVGLFIYYYEDGVKKREAVFSKNGTVAHTKVFTTGGKLMAAGKYVDEKKDSTWRFYAEKGWLISEENYIKGKREGLSKSYFEDGTVSSETTYKNDRRNGGVTEYYADRSPKMKGAYLNDTLEGKVTYYFPGNIISAEGVYKRGLKEGVWKHYTSKGVPESQVLYKGGKEIKKQIDNGVLEEFFPPKVKAKDTVGYSLKTKPVPRATYTIKGAKKDGPFVEYHETGRWVVEARMNEDGKEEYIEVLQGQKIRCKGTYKNGLLDGKITWFSVDGKIEKEEFWENGVKK
ncbi:MAG: hypothetical protein IT233_04700 [Bacteroidia bacterium]|nr:hypothetical protein [Bacteroidia bacterium]